MKTKKSAWRSIKDFSRKFGPGVITGASDDDPSGILTYLQAGVVLGVSSLWTALLSLPLMYTIQEMCGRIALVTGKGLMRLIKEHYSGLIVGIIAIISTVVITINIGADLLAIAIVTEELTNLPRLLWIVVAGAIVTVSMVVFSYEKFARILKWLTFSLVFYIVTVLYINVDWREAILSTIWPRYFSWNAESLILIVAIIGTTISPYLFFWQAEEEVEERQLHIKEKSLKRFVVTKHELKDLRGDTFLGMLLSNLVMWFIILGASNLSRLYGLSEISSFDQAALALQPLLGDKAFLIFSLGIIGTGLLAVPVLAGSIGYIIAEVFGWKNGLHLKFRRAKPFYLVIACATFVGILLSFVGLDPVHLLIYTAVLYTIITPPIILIIIGLANNKKLMGDRVNTRTGNLLAWAAFAFITIITVAYLVILAT